MGYGPRAMAHIDGFFQSVTIPSSSFLGPARQASFSSQPGTTDPQRGKTMKFLHLSDPAFSTGTRNETGRDSIAPDDRSRYPGTP